MARMRWGLAGLAVLALLGPPALASAASTTIAPGTAIAGVAIGMKEPRVASIAGPGRAVGYRLAFTYYARLGIRVSWAGWCSQPRCVLAVSTTSHRYRTRLGIGVGSSVEALRRAYPRGEMRAGVYAVPPQSVRGTLYTVRGGRVRAIQVYLSGDAGQ